MACHRAPDGKPLPGLATVAISRPITSRGRSGRPARRIDPVQYLDKGALAVIGRGKAVCEVRGVELSGRPAFCMYLGVHLTYLSGVLGRRLRRAERLDRARFGIGESRVIEGGLPPVPSGRRRDGGRAGSRHRR